MAAVSTKKIARKFVLQKIQKSFSSKRLKIELQAMEKCKESNFLNANQLSKRPEQSLQKSSVR